MKVDHADQVRLLDLAAMDEELAREAHRLRTLPERQEAADADDALAVAESAVTEAAATQRELAAERDKADEAVETVRARIERNATLMDNVRSAKDLEGLQHETESLKTRQSELEDAELEVMESLEQAEEVLARAEAERDSARQVRDEAGQRRDSAAAAIEQEISDQQEARATAAGTLPEAALGAYESVRSRVGDPGAALLRAATCQGCRLQLAATAIEELRERDPDDLAHCEECGRILVRTQESGL